MKISIKSPTRIDFSGGTLDCWPLNIIVGGCYTINLAIDVYTYAELEPISGSEIQIEITNFEYKKTFKNLEEFLNSKEKELKLLQPLVRHFSPEAGFNLKVSSESPVGGGLGGSSSLCISIIKAFGQWLNHSYETNDMVRLASNIEAEILETPTGTQDYYPAVMPGLNVIKYGYEGPSSEILPIDPKLIEDHLTVVYTGAPHHSGINNWQVLKRAIDKDEATLSALHKIKDIADEMYLSLLNQDFDQLPRLFQAEFEARVQLSPGFSSPEIEKIKELVLPNHAEAVKICGAGGGGCIFVWSKNKQEIESLCQENGFQILKVKPVAS